MLPALAATLLTSTSGCGFRPETTTEIPLVLSIATTQHLASITYDPHPDYGNEPLTFVFVNVGNGKYRCVYKPSGGMERVSDLVSVSQELRAAGVAAGPQEIYDVLYNGPSSHHERVDASVMVMHGNDGLPHAHEVDAKKAAQFNHLYRGTMDRRYNGRPIPLSIQTQHP